MKLEQLAITLRPRNPWEALDLGLRFAMQNARSLYANWLAFTLPVMVLAFLCIGAGFDRPAWAAFLLWWLKPAFDRIAVHVISRAVFGESASIRETWRTLPRLLFTTGLIRSLTLSRFSIWRSLLLPVDVLEGLRGRTARQRKALIARKLSGVAGWHTLAWLHLEIVCWLGVWALVGMLIPIELFKGFENSFIDAFVEQMSWYSCASLSLISLLLEPLYVAGGFMLYLKRRTDLEAWDVELQFRHLAQTHTANAVQTGMSLLCALCLAGLLAFNMPPAQANDARTTREQASARAPTVLKQVLRRPEFGNDQTHYRLRWRSDGSQSSPKKQATGWQSWLEALTHGLQKLGEWLATIGRVGGWVMIALAVTALLWLIGRVDWRPRRRTPPPPTELAGFDIRPQSLPENIPETAHGLLLAGDMRAALSLLFRGSLSRLAHQEQVPFARGDTEGDCLKRISEYAPARAAFIARLLGCWQRLAYAHQPIAAAELESICQEWRREFGLGAGHV